MQWLVFTDQGALDLTESPTVGGLRDSSLVDRILIKFIEVEGVRPGQETVGHLFVRQLVLVYFDMFVGGSLIEYVGGRHGTVPDQLQVRCRILLAVLLV